MRDVVYMIQEELPNDGEELRYSLRSLKNLPHGKVWLFGPRLPDWVDPDTVGHIPWSQWDGKYQDLSAKWLQLPALDQVSEKMIYMDDDMYVTKRIKNPHTYYTSSLEDALRVTQSIQDRHVGTYDMHPVYVATYRLLRDAGVKVPLVPLQHTPFPMRRSSVPIDLEDGRGPYEWKTVTYNMVRQPRVYHKEVKANTMDALYRIRRRGVPYLSSDDHMKFYESGVRNWLQFLFPERSKYERV